MIRARFKTTESDYRPVNWPIKHPYWCTGYDADDNPILVAYADDEAEVMRNWPEAFDIEADQAAERVKLADIADNADESRLAMLDEATASRLREKYAKAREALQGHNAQ